MADDKKTPEKPPNFDHCDPKFVEQVVKADMRGDLQNSLTPAERIAAARRLQEAAAEKKGRT